MSRNIKEHYSPVAIISMAARFPGAACLDDYWNNLISGIESIRRITQEDLVAEAVDPSISAQPGYVNAKGVLDNIDMFDAEFFGFTPREAEILDPQQRIFLELAWEALERSGYVAQSRNPKVAIFAGASPSTYLINNLLQFQALLKTVGRFEMQLSNSTDYLPTRTSYKLDLRGPSIAVQTACSTSLVAVHMACRSLHDGECDLALAGAISISVPHRVGYVFREGGIASPDGHCRAFDANARGTVGGSGGGVLILKRLDDALADEDHIHAVILGSAVNNDGSSKVGFTAPSVSAQSSAIDLAYQRAGVDPGTIGYLEGHGSGTPLGDPIELAALTEAFRLGTNKTQFCAIGSVKSNIGHLDAAAGIAGLIKAALAVERGVIPMTLHYKSPNPLLEISNTPFYVASETKAWPSDLSVRRAGVSSFGIGGTNAHIVLQQPPTTQPSQASHRPYSLLLFSGRTEAALANGMGAVSECLEASADLNLADVAYTLQSGRRRFKHRVAVVCRDQLEAVNVISGRSQAQILASTQEAQARRVAFMFPGLGDHYKGMARGLYETESVFREHVGRVLGLAQKHYDFDLANALFPESENAEGRGSTADPDTDGAEAILTALRNLRAGRPTPPHKVRCADADHVFVFSIEYATAMLLQSWGLHPFALIGHSLGEYSAAAVAGIMSAETAVHLLCKRSELFRRINDGSMLAVSLSAEEVQYYLRGIPVTVAAENSPSQCVVSGPHEQIEAIRHTLSLSGIAHQLLFVSKPYHSQAVDPIITEYEAIVRTQELRAPRIPLLSNSTGNWITHSEAISPHYWASHMRHPVLFEQGVRKLRDLDDIILLEVGPGHSLCSFAAQVSDKCMGAEQVLLPTIRHRDQQTSDSAFLLKTIGRMWLAGATIDWSAFHAGEARRMVHLPTYVFDRRRYWAGGAQPEAHSTATPASESPPDSVEARELFSVPVWTRSASQPDPTFAPKIFDRDVWVLFSESGPLENEMCNIARLGGATVHVVRKGSGFQRLGAEETCLNPTSVNDYLKLFAHWDNTTERTLRLVHLWTVAEPHDSDLAIESEFCSLLAMVQALDQLKLTSQMQLRVVTSSVNDVLGNETLRPENAVIQGLCRVVRQEYPRLECRCIDVPFVDHRECRQLASMLAWEVAADRSEGTVAFRGVYRWTQSLQPVHLADTQPRLRENGVYVITGGLGGIGLKIAEFLLMSVNARVALIGRTVPDRTSGTDAAGHGDAQSVRAALELLDAGQERVSVHGADVTDLDQMTEVFREIRERWQTINGVIHAAGVAGGGALALRTPDDALKVLAPKVRGTKVLAQVTGAGELDFMVLCSSVTSLRGGMGQGDYCAANAFLDTFAVKHSKGGTFTVSINWPAWKEVGMTVNTPVPALMKAQRDRTLRAGINPSEGVDAFRRILAANYHQIVVSRHVQQTENDVPAIDTTEGTSRHPRPQIATPFTPSGNAAQKRIIAIWEELFGVEPIGIHDSFFDLGGHSLLAIRLVARVREAFGVNLPIRAVFESSSVALLAKAIESASPEATHPVIQRAIRDMLGRVRKA